MNISDYPISKEQIVECVLRIANELNEAFSIEHNPKYYWTHPTNDSTEWGCLYEREFRRRMNKLGVLQFEPGEHNSGEDLTCIDNPDFSMEVKTTKSNRFWNTNSNSRTQESTKYKDPDKKTFYVMIKHKVTENDMGEAHTDVLKIYFGMLSKNDWKNPNGAGAAYLMKDVIDKNFELLYEVKEPRKPRTKKK